MFDALEEINKRPRPFEFYTAKDLWTDEYTSTKMLAYHLNEEVDMSSRNTKFIDRSVEWIASRFDIVEGTRIADFGCGPGLYATRLAKKGARVMGIDFSKRSVEYAKAVADREQLNIDYVNQNYLDSEIEDRFDLIIMIMCDFCALSPAQRRRILSKFQKILRPGGSVLLDVYSLSAFEQRQEAATYAANLLDHFWSSSEYFGFLNTFKYEDEKVVLDKYTIVEPEKIWVVYNWLQYFSSDELENEFCNAGLSVDEYYSDVSGTVYDSESSEFAVIATPR